MTRASVDRAPPHRLGEDVARALRADLLKVFRARTSDAAWAEDLAQEAMSRVLDGLGAFRGRASLRTWAHRIALNLWRDELRRPSRATVPAGDGEALSILAWLDAGDGAAGASPDATADRDATRACLLDTIDQLPPSERAAVVLHELGDLSLERTAEALGCSVGAVKVRLHRGRRKVVARCRTDCVEEAGETGDRVCARRRQRGKAPERTDR
jgi:RNA polymerase sigma-70 factor (ECF subfamily)